MSQTTTRRKDQRVEMPCKADETLTAIHYSDYREYIDGMLVMNPPTRRHVQIARRLARVPADAVYGGGAVPVSSREDPRPDRGCCLHCP